MMSNLRLASSSNPKESFSLFSMAWKRYWNVSVLGSL
jgi:hypothetical protein